MQLSSRCLIQRPAQPAPDSLSLATTQPVPWRTHGCPVYTELLWAHSLADCESPVCPSALLMARSAGLGRGSAPYLAHSARPISTATCPVTGGSSFSEQWTVEMFLGVGSRGLQMQAHWGCLSLTFGASSVPSVLSCGHAGLGLASVVSRERLAPCAAGREGAPHWRGGCGAVLDY